MEGIVIDSFDVKGRVAIDYGATGVVAILETHAVGAPPRCGNALLVIKPDGWMTRASAGEVKQHAPAAYGVFLAGLTKHEVPVGSKLRWGREFWPAVPDADTAETTTSQPVTHV